VLQKPLHSIHAVLLAGTVPLFLGVFFSDFAYSRTYEIQWKNFASWLLVGGLILGGLTLLWAAIDISRAAARTTWEFIYAGLLLALWIVGFINALVHAGDAWASMPTALNLSAIAAVTVMAATWLGFHRFHRGVTP
jgi:uncharacterized membrane protein